MKSKEWQKVSYSPSDAAVPPSGLRQVQVKWKRSLAELLTANTDGIVKKLRTDGLVPKWEGKACPHCGKGTLSKLKKKAAWHFPKHRCSAKKCKRYLNPHHLHPLFLEGHGSGSTSLQVQASLLFLLLNNIHHSVIHRFLHLNHKAIEDMDKRLCDLRKSWVKEKESEIIFGNNKSWTDVEADETTFDKKDVTGLLELKDPAKPLEWEQWCGIVQRGKPESLILHRLRPEKTEKRAPGPGAIRKVEWQPLAQKWLADRKVILHTDSAKSYTAKVQGVLHDKVVHCKKKVKVRGKWTWQKPTFVKLVKHKDPTTRKVLKVKAGTQIIDRAWRFMKERLQRNQNVKVGSARLRAKLRSTQYQYWHKDKDLWMESGNLCTWGMKKFISL